MDMLSLYLPGVRLIGWTLVHSVWQGVLVGLVYATARAILPAGEARYRAGMAALLALLLCPFATAWHLLGASAPSAGWSLAPLPVVHAVVSADGAVANGLPPGTTWLHWLDAALPWLVLVWSLGVLLLSWRAWRQWRRLRIMVQAAAALPAWQRRAAEMAVRFGLRRSMRILCSEAVSAPALIGWLRPVVLLPAAVVTGFSVTQIEWILAHELAHLRRWDPLANLFQVILETLYFHHPVVHWISREVRNERELCCDALALSCRGGDPREFAATLADLGELQATRDTLLLAADGGVLLERVRQLATPAQQTSAGSRASARFAAVWLGAIVLVVALQLQRQQTGMRWLQIESMVPRSMALTQSRKSFPWQLSDPIPTRLRAVEPIRIDTPDVAGTLPAIKPTLPSLMPAQRTAQALQVVRPGYPMHMPGLSAVELVARAPSVAEAPRAIRISQPIYPASALEQGISGRVVVEFALASDGGVRSMRVVAAEPAGVFEAAALRAIGGWKYAVPAGAVVGQRYRQVLVFDPLPGAVAGTDEVLAASSACRMVTGSHICRRYDDASEIETSGPPADK